MSGIARDFDRSVLENELLEITLKDKKKSRYVRQLTGLRDPSVLVEIGKYFRRTAILWYPWSGKNGKDDSKKRAAWLGCSGSGFNLSAGGNLGSGYATHGALLGAAGAQTKK